MDLRLYEMDVSKARNVLAGCESSLERLLTNFGTLLAVMYMIDAQRLKERMMIQLDSSKMTGKDAEVEDRRR